MSWKDEYLSILDEANLFENSGHRTRFKELLDCYGGFPFFTKGLCKCIYLSAWDDEHFTIMLETLTEMSLGRQLDTDEMSAKGESMAFENEESAGEFFMYQLSIALLEERPFTIPENLQLPDHYLYIIQKGMKAAQVIDQANIAIPH